MGSFRKELVADVQSLLGADAHECVDIRLLERTEHVVDFLHGSLSLAEANPGAAVTCPRIGIRSRRSASRQRLLPSGLGGIRRHRAAHCAVASSAAARV